MPWLGLSVNSLHIKCRETCFGWLVLVWMNFFLHHRSLSTVIPLHLASRFGHTRSSGSASHASFLLPALPIGPVYSPESLGHGRSTLSIASEALLVPQLWCTQDHEAGKFLSYWWANTKVAFVAITPQRSCSPLRSWCRLLGRLHFLRACSLR